MGAESYELFIKKDCVKDISLLNGWIEESAGDNVKDILNEFFFAHFENVEGEALDVFRATGLPLIKDGKEDADYVFELDRSSLVAMIDKCQKFISESILIYNDDDYARSELKKFVPYIDYAWDDELPETLCILLKRLKAMLKALDKYADHTFIVEIMW